MRVRVRVCTDACVCIVQLSSLIVISSYPLLFPASGPQITLLHLAQKQQVTPSSTKQSAQLSSLSKRVRHCSKFMLMISSEYACKSAQ